MQQGITRREGYEPALSAVIGGREVELESASMDRMLPDPVAGGSLTAASGELVTVEGPDTVEHVATPWDPGTQWPPVPETSASVDMDTGSGPVSLLRGGRVVSASGGTSGREVGVEVADAYQSLDKTISWDEFADAMPSLGEAEHARYVGLRASALTDRILRHCGWYATPPMLQYCILSVPAMGTVWPEYGTCTASGSRSGEGAYPGFFTEQWGAGVTNLDASYQLRGGGYSVKSRGRVELTAIAGRTNGGSMFLEADLDGGGSIRLWWTDGLAYVSMRSPRGVMEVYASLPRSVGSFLYATIEYVEGYDDRVRVILRCDGNVRNSIQTVHPQVVLSPLRTAKIAGDGVGGGFQIACPSQPGALVSWVPNAVINDRGGSANSLRVVPPVESENCAELLQEQCEAQGATYWIDETGVLRWWDLARLESRSAVATLTSSDDIDEAGFQWSHSLSSVQSRVSVKWREPARTWSWRTSVDLWQGSGRTLQPGDVIEDWITVPDDEVWIMPDVSLSRAGTHDITDLNYGIGSWYGGVIAGSGDDADQWAQLRGSLLMTVERVTGKAFKTWAQWTGSLPATQRTPSERSSSALWMVRRNADLPVIRGKAKFAFADRVTHSAQSGPVTAPERVVEAGWWIQDEEQAQYTADYYGARLTVPQPVVSSIALIPVPGLQIGDVVEVRDEDVSHVTIRGLIIEDSRSINADMDMGHSVAVRPVLVSKNRVTWEEWGAVMAGRTWESWGARQQPKTWEQWGNAPLDGEVA